jgi:hypothetical protein
MLVGGHSDDESDQLIGDFDLAGEPAVRPSRVGEFEHRNFHLRPTVNESLGTVDDEDVAGRARALAAAIGVDPRDTVLHGAFHDGPAFRNLDGVFRPAVFDVDDPGHLLSLLAGMTA